VGERQDSDVLLRTRMRVIDDTRGHV
jgi:hypothetical protein